jgi:hypothetical protein
MLVLPLCVLDHAGLSVSIYTRAKRTHHVRCWRTLFFSTDFPFFSP